MPNFAQNKFAQNKQGPGGGRGQVQQRFSRFSAVNDAEGGAGGRDPQLAPGDYVLEVVSTIESHIQGKAPWFKIKVNVLESLSPEGTPPGTMSTLLFCTNQESESSTFPKLRDWMWACTGCSNKEEFAAMEAEQGVHPGGFLDDASLGGQTFVGSKFACRVYHGKADGNGGFYNEYLFAIAD